MCFIPLYLCVCEGGTVLFGFVSGVTSMPCPIRMVFVGYFYMDSGSVSQNVRLVSREFPESS